MRADACAWCSHCFLGRCRGEVWTLDVDPSETRLATGSSDAELRIYEINAGGGEVARGGEPGQAAAAADGQQQGQAGGATSGSDFLIPMGSLRRQAPDRAETLRYASLPGAHGGVLLACQSAGKVAEVYRVRSEAEAVKKMKRRRRRRREKLEKKAAAAAAGEPEDAAAAAAGGGEVRLCCSCCGLSLQELTPAGSPAFGLRLAGWNLYFLSKANN